MKMGRPTHPQAILVEDDAALSSLIADELETAGWQVRACGRLAEAHEALSSTTPALVITDLRLPDGNGMDLVRHLTNGSADESRPGIIVITAFGSVRQAVDALKLGADDFLTKPLDLDHFMICVSRLMETCILRDEVKRHRILNRQTGFHGLIGNSKAMRRLHEQVRVIAHAHGPVLITGESGTGKELVANAIHTESDRADSPFLAVNCAGIPPELLESEFFGHAVGAFTGAGKPRRGLLQETHGGTLMLDEIGEMPLPLQAKLLRALQDGSIRPVGQDSEVKVDVRIVAATHQNLRAKVSDGVFREDLYYRLEAFTLQVPPLRDRGEDLELLAYRFLYQFAAAQGKVVEGITPRALSLLQDYQFPGNVRELQNVMERSVAFCEGGWIGAEHLPDRLRDSRPAGAESGPAHAEEDVDALLDGPSLPTMDELQKRYAHFMLKHTNGNKRRTAALLGIGRRTLYRWLEAGDESQEK